MVSTRPQNKDAHPGVPDQRNPRKGKDTSDTTQDEHQRAIHKVAAVEHTLMETQRRANENAHHPPGPSRSEKRQVSTAGMSNIQPSSATCSPTSRYVPRNLKGEPLGDATLIAGQVVKATATNSSQLKQLAAKNFVAVSGTYLISLSCKRSTECLDS